MCLQLNYSLPSEMNHYIIFPLMCIPSLRLINIYFFSWALCVWRSGPLWWCLLLPFEPKHHFNTCGSTLYLHGLDFYCRSHQQQGSFMRWEQKKMIALEFRLYTVCSAHSFALLSPPPPHPPTPPLSNKHMKTDLAAHTFTFIYRAVHAAQSFVEWFYLWILSCKVFGSVFWRTRHFFFFFFCIPPGKWNIFLTCCQVGFLWVNKHVPLHPYIQLSLNDVSRIQPRIADPVSVCFRMFVLVR